MAKKLEHNPTEQSSTQDPSIDEIVRMQENAARDARDLAVFESQKMTSLDISELVDSRHDKVKQSIERLAKSNVIQLPPMGEVKDNQSLSPNNTTKVYIFDKTHERDTYIVVAQLCPEFMAKIVDRWLELENEALFAKGDEDLREMPRFIKLRKTYLEGGATPNVATMGAARQLFDETGVDYFNLVPRLHRPGVPVRVTRLVRDKDNVPVVAGEGVAYTDNNGLEVRDSQYRADFREDVYTSMDVKRHFGMTRGNFNERLVEAGILEHAKEKGKYCLTTAGIRYGLHLRNGSYVADSSPATTFKWKESVLDVLPWEPGTGRPRTPPINMHTGLPWGEKEPVLESPKGPHPESLAARGLSLGQAMKDYEAARLAYQLGESDYDPDNPPTTEHSDEKLYTGHEARFNFDAIDGAFNMGF